jgi:hypothetical protein
LISGKFLYNSNHGQWRLVESTNVFC